MSDNQSCLLSALSAMIVVCKNKELRKKLLKYYSVVDNQNINIMPAIMYFAVDKLDDKYIYKQMLVDIIYGNINYGAYLDDKKFSGIYLKYQFL